MEAVSARPAGAINNVLKVLLIAGTVAFLAIIGWNLRDTTVREGDRAPVFSVHTDQGREVTPEHFDGKVLVLNFWATWCAPCITEIPSLNEFQRKFRDKGVVVLAVSVDKNQEKYKRFLQRFKLAFETYRDPDSNISASYGTFQYPETYIIKDGRVVRKYISDQNWLSSDIDQYVQSLL
jgi:cytochrome c biogenesis protein CcmG, thiol:disulfide interchange protein DsbE